MVEIRPVQAPEDLPTPDGLPAGPGELARWLQPGNIGLVARSDQGDTVGLLLLVPERWFLSSVRSMRVISLCVVEARRRQGIARSLLTAAAKKAAGNGVRCVHVAIRPSNEAALSLFERLDTKGGANYVVDLSHRGF